MNSCRVMVSANWVTRLWGIVKYYSSQSPTINIAIDNELGSVSGAATVIPNVAIWQTAAGITAAWLTATGLVSTWLSNGTGYSVFSPDAIGQEGVLTGFTVTTNAADMAIVSMMIHDEVAGYRG